jgi:hypothetical protein
MQVGKGYCGDGADCAWYKKCSVPPMRGSLKLAPELYLPSQQLGGLGARQGMHMVDVSSPELGVMQGKPPVTFNTSWILGGSASWARRRRRRRRRMLPAVSASGCCAWAGEPRGVAARAPAHLPPAGRRHLRGRHLVLGGEWAAVGLLLAPPAWRASCCRGCARCAL